MATGGGTPAREGRESGCVWFVTTSAVSACRRRLLLILALIVSVCVKGVMRRELVELAGVVQ
jgi:hypothetical protein